MVAAFAASLSEHPIPSAATGEAVGQVLDQLGDGPVDLALLFASASHSGAFEDICDAVRTLLRPRAFLGSTAVGVIGGAREVEARSGLSLFAARLPGTGVNPLRLRARAGSEGPLFEGLPSRAGGALLVLTDPFSFPADAFLDHVDRVLPGTTVVGGLASAARGPGGNRLALDGQVVCEGAVGVHLEGAIEVSTVVSQGCRPIGQAYVVTRAERNVVYELGGKAAFERLRELASEASEDDRVLMRAGLHLGCVVDEHQLDFNRGDFLVRGVIGADPTTGAIAVGEVVPVGRTVQFHVRDAASADEDLRDLLAGTSADAALLFTCNGRGTNMFPGPDHDAATIERLLGPIPLAGCFCAGELGPVGTRSFLHAFTASLALFRSLRPAG